MIPAFAPTCAVRCFFFVCRSLVMSRLGRVVYLSPVRADIYSISSQHSLEISRSAISPQLCFSSHPRHVSPMDPPDIFKHENGMHTRPLFAQRQLTPASVDLLLQEMAASAAEALSYSESTSAVALPTKPLNFPPKDDDHLDSKTRDFNSSTDTYVSEPAPSAEPEPRRDSLSHSRSIMRSAPTPSGLPKKLVAFPSEHSLETHHTYPAAVLDSHLPTTDELPMVHLWAELDQLSSTAEIDPSPPPVPPPHSSSTITGLLASADDAPPDVDISQLSEYRFSSSSLGALSLNEKLDIYLTANTPAMHDDLSTHLDRLGAAASEETDVNIRNLSFQLEDHRPPEPENPLHALSRAHNVYLNSAHSSQLSLQSLVDSNRVLEASMVDSHSKGIQLSDGIKGFTDNQADTIIPLTADHDSSAEMLSFKTRLLNDYPTPGQEYHDSFDRSYNLTEKSIMNLLNSASQLDLQQQDPEVAGPLPPSSTKEHPASESDKLAAPNGTLDNTSAQERDVDQPQVENAPSNEAVKHDDLFTNPSLTKEELTSFVKQEPSFVGSSVKTEPNSHATEEHKFIVKEAPTSMFKEEPTSFVKEEPTSFVKEEPNSSVEEESDSFVKEEPHSIVKEEPHSIVKEEETLFVFHATPNALPEYDSKAQSDPFKLELGTSVAKPELADLPEDDEIPKRSEKRLNPSNTSLHRNSLNRSSMEGEHISAGSEHGSLNDHVSEYSTDARTYAIQDRAVASGAVKLVDSRSGTPIPKLDEYNWTHDGKDSDNDGDIEDDDSEDPAMRRLITAHHQVGAKLRLGDVDDETLLSASGRPDDDLKKSLAPPRSGEPTDVQRPSTSDLLAPEQHEEFDSSVLANSSNIQPPYNMKLPRVDTTDNSFADLTRKLNENSSSFEEMLSAENDQDKKSLDFLSIWHSQQKGRRYDPRPPVFSYKVPSILSYNTADLSQYGKYHIPEALQPKKFKEVNVISTRVVSAHHEDFNVSGFLPEISHDSGLEDHFHGLLNKSGNLDGNTTIKSDLKIRRRSIGALTQFQAALGEDSPPPPRSTKRHSIGSLRPNAPYGSSYKSIIPSTPVKEAKRSKFHVPSFEIKRSNSILSPKNQYNDIFEDGSFVEPTMKAAGMKTLPSMDRDDVKRIMQMKQAMTQEEYSRLKVGTLRKQVVHLEPSERYDSLQQQASIYSESVVSEPAGKRVTVDSNFSHVVGELTNRPVAIAARDQLLDDLDMFQLNTTQKSPEKKTAITLLKKTDPSNFPEPDADLISNPATSPRLERTAASAYPTKPVFGILEQEEDQTTEEPIKSAPKVAEPPREVLGAYHKNVTHKVKHNKLSPVKDVKGERRGSNKSSPIKISSPVRLVKSGGSVTGIVLDKRAEDVFKGGEILNKKVRGDDHKHGISTVSVPSNLTDDTVLNIGGRDKPTNLAKALREELGTGFSEAESRKSAKTTTPPIHERGKLFLRVVGLKNIDLPDIKNRKGDFSITLDNGVHCIKTPNYSLDSLSVIIGKEFELTVKDSLQFILTFKATYDKPRGTLKQVTERKVVKSKNKFSRLFGSKDVITTTKYVPREVSDPWENRFATDGSFARCYVDLEQYESQINGIACNFNISCFNEWATIHQGAEVKKVEPYKIAQLEVKMLYVPRSEPYEVLPMSIKAAYESLDDLKKESGIQLEGYLHQEGGDCDMWKKRWFKLCGTSLIAHSEFSHKTRAKINLAKVVEVIYVDKENINRSSSNYRNFSDILLVENAFKIRFANGEIIDFGAPNKDEKLQWIKAIQEIVYRNKFRRQPWVKTMQAKNGNRRPQSIIR